MRWKTTQVYWRGKFAFEIDDNKILVRIWDKGVQIFGLHSFKDRVLHVNLQSLIYCHHGSR